ncbi:MAG: MFS transporter [Stellaceae bacterium]
MTDGGSDVGFGNAVRVFRIRNYRLFAIGNFVSRNGYWIQRVAQAWLAWELTHSGTWLGLVAAADLVPNIVISPFAGALADRVDRLTQLAAITQAWLLAILCFTGVITIGVFRAGPAMGALIGGWLASRLGFHLPVVAGACACIASWAWTWSRLDRIRSALEGPMAAPGAAVAE